MSIVREPYQGSDDSGSISSSAQSSSSSHSRVMKYGGKSDDPNKSSHTDDERTRSYTGLSMSDNSDVSSTTSSVLKNPTYSAFYEFLVDRQHGGQINVTDALIMINTSIQDLIVAVDANSKKKKKKKKEA